MASSSIIGLKERVMCVADWIPVSHHRFLSGYEYQKLPPHATAARTIQYCKVKKQRSTHRRRAIQTTSLFGRGASNALLDCFRYKNLQPAIVPVPEGPLEIEKMPTLPPYSTFRTDSKVSRSAFVVANEPSFRVGRGHRQRLSRT